MRDAKRLHVRRTLTVPKVKPSGASLKSTHQTLSVCQVKQSQVKASRDLKISGKRVSNCLAVHSTCIGLLGPMFYAASNRHSPFLFVCQDW